MWCHSLNILFHLTVVEVTQDEMELGLCPWYFACDWTNWHLLYIVDSYSSVHHMSFTPPGNIDVQLLQQIKGDWQVTKKRSEKLKLWWSCLTPKSSQRMVPCLGWTATYHYIQSMYVSLQRLTSSVKKKQQKQVCWGAIREEKEPSDIPWEERRWGFLPQIAEQLLHIQQNIHKPWYLELNTWPLLLMDLTPCDWQHWQPAERNVSDGSKCSFTGYLSITLTYLASYYSVKVWTPWSIVLLM